ncbi:hypothetical protein CAPTEDRAFT_211027 [Capitella teleta]|uniref:Prokaryotic glutathione synthetase ATP-binding domain-containing protein n=1 Tax=Capitella teleta TaxID=283909 RepID=R7V6U5_CAPTE|nr:hypothetical protein CAPTEDRAFT_211027 [Capitella teleta]|eukprot:ELU14593.1 hypothetical protein CAPTEDRAFT_211027 [Capitella teleta]
MASQRSEDVNNERPTRIAIAEYRDPEKPSPGIRSSISADGDDEFLVDELRRHRCVVTFHPWDCCNVRWEDFDVIIIRKTWDYHLKYDAFLEWIQCLEQSGVKVVNPPQVLRWNTNKRYLEHLSKKGVAIINTIFVDKGQAPSLTSIMQKWPKIVLKPIIGLNGHQVTKIYNQENMTAKQEAFQLMLNDSQDGVMVQPYMPGAQMELSIIFIAGLYSHAIRLQPGESENRDYRQPLRCHPHADAMTVAECAIKACPWEHAPVYARVDLVEDFEEGGYKLMEMELVEPSLYLNVESAVRLANVILKQPQS